MDIRNIAVVLDAEKIDEDLVALASDLARRHHAVLTGIAAAEPPVMLMAMEGGDVAGAVYAEQYRATEESLAATGAAFERLVPVGVKHRWVASIQRPDAAVAAAARTVDLILVGAARQEGGRPSIDIGAVLLGSGRPVLVPARGARKLKADRIMVAWKDTKEARRAIVDALPFLRTADDVSVVVVDEGNLASERASMLDAVAWLASHEVTAHGDVLPDTGGLAATIAGAAASTGADLIVSGAYGHSRLREWLLGGMTRDLLATPGINRLFSN